MLKKSIFLLFLPEPLRFVHILIHSAPICEGHIILKQNYGSIPVNISEAHCQPKHKHDALFNALEKYAKQQQERRQQPQGCFDIALLVLLGQPRQQHHKRKQT